MLNVLLDILDVGDSEINDFLEVIEKLNLDELCTSTDEGST